MSALSNIANLSVDNIVLLLGALISDELKLMRRVGGSDKDAELLKGYLWQRTTVLALHHRSAGAENEVCVDSLEWLAIASRVIDFFQMEESGIEDYLLRYFTLGEWAEVVSKSRELGSTAIRFSTSGSTGIAKKIVHSWQTLVGETVFFNKLLRALPTAPMRLVALVPPHHIYGFLFSVMLPQALDVPVARGISSFAAVFNGRLKKGDVVIVFPSLLQQFEQRCPAFPAGVTIVCSTGPCPAETLQSLRQRGIETILEVYGSSETAGMGYRTEPTAAYKLLPRWTLTEQQTLSDATSGAEFNPPDRLDWISDTLFRPCGRLDHAVSVNGKNVFPLKIARQLATQAQVVDARVRLISSNSSRGLKALLLVATSLTAEQQQALIKQVHAWAVKHLSAEEIPLHYTVANEIPKNDMGKEIDWSDMENQL
jgi:long-chain acyl-CoA synthetase